MSFGIFGRKKVKSETKSFEKYFGRSLYLWIDLRKHIHKSYKGIMEEWKLFDMESACIVKVLQNKRIIFYATPKKHSFEIAFSFGTKAVEAIKESSIPEEIIERVVQAQKFLEGRGLQILIKNSKDLKIAKQLIEVKIAN